MMATMMYVAHSDPAFHEPVALHQAKRAPSTDELSPAAVEQLKQLIRKTHHTKYFAFSLLDMRKVSTPPVQIPAMYRCTTATKTLVGGRAVPLTRLMSMRLARQHPHALPTVFEGDEDASSDRRK